MAEQQRRNRLASATSPYLLQHADNPVDWFPWGEEAFEKARREDKPIFLSVGYSTCHWCHVMARESFSDPEIAELLNAHFVSVKVDREERPDVDEVYMRAVLLFTNGHGGWPMSVFLTPEGKPFFGGTYFPPHQFKTLLREIVRVWQTERERVLQVANEVAQLVQTELELVAPTEWEQLTSEQVLRAAEEMLLRQLDRLNGGFERAPKFPPHQALQFLLRRYVATQRPALWEAVELTLQRMARGGLYDHIGGGFHRYCVDEIWLVPHFEKMLYDNAQLAPTYAQAFALSGENFFRFVAEETYAFLLREMHSPEGAFYSALDAESLPPENPNGPKEEGAFYLWRPHEVKAVLGEEEGELFCKIYGISDEPNFVNPHTGYSGCVPNLLRAPIANWAKALGMTEGELWHRLKAMRERLRLAREQRPRPHCDDKVLTSWNALAICGFTMGYRILGDERYRVAAEKAAEFLLTHLRRPDGALWHSYRNGVAQVEGMLDDYAFLLVALLELHKVTGQSQWLREACALADLMVRLFWDESVGGFWFTRERSDVFARSKPAFDGAEPSPNGMAALGLLRLADETGETAYATLAQQTVQTFGGLLLRFPRGFLTLLSALQEWQKTQQVAVRTELSEPIEQMTVEPSPIVLKLGETMALQVKITVADGWHLYGQEPIASFHPTQLSLESQLLAMGETAFPLPSLRSFSFVDLPVPVYEGSLTVTVKVRAVREGNETALFRLRFQACDDQRCLAPSEKTLPVSVTVVPQ